MEYSYNLLIDRLDYLLSIAVSTHVPPYLVAIHIKPLKEYFSSHHDYLLLEYLKGSVALPP